MAWGGPRDEILKHYQFSRAGFLHKMKKWRASPNTVSAKPRSGRPAIMTPDHLEALRKLNREARGAGAERLSRMAPEALAGGQILSLIEKMRSIC